MVDLGRCGPVEVPGTAGHLSGSGTSVFRTGQGRAALRPGPAYGLRLQRWL